METDTETHILHGLALAFKTMAIHADIAAHKHTYAHTAFPIEIGHFADLTKKHQSNKNMSRS